MKVFLTDDHSIIFPAYTSLLNKLNCTVVGTSTSGEELVQWLEDNTCDLIILDLSLPGMSGIQVLKAIFDYENVPRILIVSGTYDVKQIQEAIVLGAKGFILKGEVHQCLEEALLKIKNGRKYYSDTVLDEILLKQLETDNMISLEEIFSKREGEALYLMTENFETKDILKKMNISNSSFYTLRTRMKEKIGVKNIIRLVILAIKYKFKVK